METFFGNKLSDVSNPRFCCAQKAQVPMKENFIPNFMGRVFFFNVKECLTKDVLPILKNRINEFSLEISVKKGFISMIPFFLESYLFSLTCWVVTWESFSKVFVVRESLFAKPRCWRNWAKTHQLDQTMARPFFSWSMFLLGLEKNAEVFEFPPWDGPNVSWTMKKKLTTMSKSFHSAMSSAMSKSFPCRRTWRGRKKWSRNMFIKFRSNGQSRTLFQTGFF